MKKIFSILWAWLTLPVLMVRTSRAIRGNAEYYGRAGWDHKKYCKVAAEWRRDRQKRPS